MRTLSSAGTSVRDLVAPPLTHGWVKGLPSRRAVRRFARKTAYVGVILASIAGMLLNDEAIYAATWRAIHEEERISLRPGMWAVAGDNLRQAATSVLRSLNNLLPTWFPPGAPEVMRPAGHPYGWQSSDAPIPFTEVNLATANTLTSVPVVGWGGLGRGIQFTLFRNALDVADDLNTLPSGWTHSYSRRLIFAPGCDGTGGGGSGSQGFYGENQSNAPQGDESNAPEGGGDDVPAGSGSDVPSGTAFDAAPSSFGAEGGGGGAPGIWLRTDDGRKIFFLDNGDNTYTAPPGIDFKLERIVGPSVTYKLTDHRQNVDIFDQNGWLTSIQDGSNNTTTLAYGGGALHRLLSITDPAGNVVQLKYCGSLGGKLTQIHAPPIIKGVTAVSRMFYVTYDGNGRVYRITKAVADNNPPNCDLPPPAVYWAEFGYTTEGLLSQVLDHNGNATTIEYDDGVIYRVTHPPVIDYIVNPQQPISTTSLYDFTFHPADPIINPCGFPCVATASVTDERGGVTEYAFDESGRLETIVDPLDRTIATLVWNNDNRLDSSTGPIPSSTIFDYDAAGNTTEVEDANMHSIIMTYDSLNNLTSMTDPLGQTVSYEYTDATNPTQVTRVDGVGTSDIDLSYGSDPTRNLGQLLGLDSANYINQSFDYTQTNLLSGEKGGFLKESSFGRVMGETEPMTMTNATFERGPTGASLKSTIYEWESVGNAVEPGPVGSCSPVYDLDGNVIQTCAASGISECDAPTPGTKLLLLQYDGNDNIIATGQEMPVGGTLHTEYTYDAMDRVTMEDYSADTYLVTFQQHMHIDPKHTIQRDYSDTTGRYRMMYERQAFGGGDPPCESRPGITIEYYTDAAGRVTQIDRTDGAGPTHTTTYAYNDSIVLPAIVETKPNGFVTEYYVDIVGQVRKVIHLQPAQGGGLTEVKAFVYTRDARDRITQVDDFDNGLPGVTTLYTYGDGHLTTADLDPSSSVDPVKLYWYWLDPLHLQAGDPNRLVKEERVGRDRKEYWYDAGGNRLSMRESIWDLQEQTWEVEKITRYNYSRVIDYNENSLTFNPANVPVFCEPAPVWRLCTGEPTESLAPQGNDPAGGYGRDQLISHKSYYPNEPTLLEYTVYIHYGELQIGRLHRKVDITNNYDGPSGPWLKTTTSFGYDTKNRTSAIQVQRYASDGEPYNWSYLGAFLEAYGYDWKGHRIARAFCDDPDPEQEFTIPWWCKPTVEAFDYDGSRVLVERNCEQLGDIEPGCDRFTSTFTWGPLGLITRVHERNDVDLGTNCFYHYLSDGRGTNVGYIPHDLTQQPTPVPVFFPMDAWGNLYAELPVEYCPRDSGVEVTKDFQGGKYQYHGSDGYQTDLLGPIYNPNQEERGRSTGFIYIGARFYDPATGRFLQADRTPIDQIPFAWGQNNKWTYAANDPVNAYDIGGYETMTGQAVAVAVMTIVATMLVTQYFHRDLVEAGQTICSCMASPGDQRDSGIMAELARAIAAAGLVGKVTKDWICNWLDAEYKKARTAKNFVRAAAIKATQKALGCRRRRPC